MSLRDLLAVGYGTIRSLSTDVALSFLADGEDATYTDLMHAMCAPALHTAANWLPNISTLHSKHNNETNNELRSGNDIFFLRVVLLPNNFIAAFTAPNCAVDFSGLGVSGLYQHLCKI